VAYHESPGVPEQKGKHEDGIWFIQVRRNQQNKLMMRGAKEMKGLQIVLHNVVGCGGSYPVRRDRQKLELAKRMSYCIGRERKVAFVPEIQTSLKVGGKKEHLVERCP